MSAEPHGSAEPHPLLPTRTLVVWCVDWAVRAWGVGPADVAVALAANRVVAATPAARDGGVQVGHRRREAQSACPTLTVHERDASREARSFEAVVEAVARFAPLVEVRAAGVAALATRGPSRYFGGDEHLANSVHEAVDEATGSVGGCAVGIADGFFAAMWAARADSAPPGTSATESWGVQLPAVIPVGESAGFLAELPLGCLESPGLVEVLWRMGIRTLGAFAALPVRDVLARFGVEGVRCHRMANGGSDRPLDVRPPPPDPDAVLDFDVPVERVDQAAFAAKVLADQLHDRLASEGLACTRVLIEAETEHGESLVRLWRHEGALSAAALADRARWQLDGWLQGSAGSRPSGGLIRLALVPDEVLPARGRQLGFWGGQSRQAERASRAAARVAAMLGPEAVTVVEPRGGRREQETYAKVSVAAVDLTERSKPSFGESRSVFGASHGAPWPGLVPVSPASCHVEPVPAEVVDDAGQAVWVNGRGDMSGAPDRMRMVGDWLTVVRWAGPWPVEERWWDQERSRRQARLQVVTADGAAHLLVREHGSWWCESTFD